MTYCVGVLVKGGLVMIADTRTNAGLDNISIYRKLHLFVQPGDRALALATAGSLSVSQAVVSLLQEGTENPDTGELETINDAPTMFRAAQLIGRAIRRVRMIDGPGLQEADLRFDVSFLFGGQIKDGPMRLYMIYSAGNFIECSQDAPFLQIGEHKYGKPILDRALEYDTPIADGVKLVLVSMDSTLRSNLTVGLPIDLLIYRTDSLEVGLRRRLTEEDPYFRLVRERWSASMREAYLRLPPPDWLTA